MKRQRKRFLYLFFLFIFLSVTLFINFFHSENTFENSANCPACNFISSLVFAGQINFFHLPPPSVSGILNTFETFSYTAIIIPNPISRPCLVLYIINPWFDVLHLYAGHFTCFCCLYYCSFCVHSYFCYAIFWCIIPNTFIICNASVLCVSGVDSGWCGRLSVV